MKLTTKKKLLTLLITSSIIINPSNVYANKEITFKGDQVQATANVNIRDDNSLEGDRIGLFKEGDISYRLLEMDNNWSLIQYENIIGYVYDDYIIPILNNSNNTYQHHIINDVIYTTTTVNLRTSPTVDSKRLTSIPKNIELEPFAITENGWYLVRYNNEIGYVCKDYTYSLLNYLNQNYPNLEISELSVIKIVYVNVNNLNVRSTNSLEGERIDLLDKYESLRVLMDLENWYLVKSNDTIGFVYKEYTRELKNIFVDIDLSDQRLILYHNTTQELVTDITTGKNTTPTNKGIFTIKTKERDRFLVGEDYSSFVKYWMPFDGGIGLHDASWRQKFGGNIYKNNGSHGCVNMPPNMAEKVYEKVKKGTNVLVHK